MQEYVTGKCNETKNQLQMKCDSTNNSVSKVNFTIRIVKLIMYILPCTHILLIFMYVRKLNPIAAVVL